MVSFLSFKGRLGRWSFLWMNVARLVVPTLFNIGLALIGSQVNSTLVAQLLVYLIIGVTILVFVSGISLGVRRLHDLNFSGWWLLLMLVPFVNFVLILVLLFVKGSVGPNRYGEDPLRQAKITNRTEVVDDVPYAPPRID